MKTAIYYGTSVRAGKTYEACVTEETITTRFEAEPFAGGDDDGCEFEAGWYASRPTGGCIGSACCVTHVAGPHETEKKAYDSALKHCLREGWLVSREEAEARAETEAAERIAAKKERQKMTPEIAAAQLAAAGIFKVGWGISDRVWKKSATKLRVQAALAGDKNAAGCLRRDAVKN